MSAPKAAHFADILNGAIRGNGSLPGCCPLGIALVTRPMALFRMRRQVRKNRGTKNAASKISDLKGSHSAKHYKSD